ncbi:MAG: S8 family serine peptidase, partial [Actinomycetota bacterium]|nr:S8 family serine peptidase [Actinomycetota bacterium]
MRARQIWTLWIVALAVAASAIAGPPPTAIAPTASAPVVSVIVRELPAAGRAPETAVEAAGGIVGDHIGIIDGFVADVPRDAIASLEDAPGVHSVTPDSAITLSGSPSPGTGYDARTDPGSMLNTAEVVKARSLWERGVTGRGVDVALIDSGVAPVEGLTGVDKVVNGPDLSFESQNRSTRYLDTNGHGTHLAGIIAGRDSGVAFGRESKETKGFLGVAPDARLVSVKAAPASGATDVSQVLAAIDWVVQNRNRDGLNIRVLNLAYGTDGVQDYRVDPLTYAVEVAWRKGIVVVVAAGNRGYGSAQLNNPAYDPYVIAVGASDTKGTFPVKDDVVPVWSSRGDGTRNPDVVAPGKSLVSLRSPGSEADLFNPEGHAGDRFMRASGTSQAAAVVSGAAALLLQERPGLAPDDVKRLLVSSATPMPAADAVAQGAGLLDLQEASNAPVSGAAQTWPVATGTGSLELARGSSHLVVDGQTLSGEMDIFGVVWDPTTWTKTSWSESSWTGGTWNKTSWSGDTWTDAGWAKTSWSGAEWGKTSWSKTSWSSDAWSKT